jgi:hypothetical protein
MPVPGLQVWPPGQLTGVAAQTPPLQTSPVVHRLPSLQGLELATCWQPDAELQLSSVHTFPSSQLAGPPGTQLPPAQVSPIVQASPSVQGWELLVLAQPVLGLQVSVVQALPSLQSSAVPGWHTVATHVSMPLHRLLSLQSPSLPQGGL